MPTKSRNRKNRERETAERFGVAWRSLRLGMPGGPPVRRDLIARANPDPVGRLLGDPPPERSALGLGRQPARRNYWDPKPVTLPRMVTAF